nr:transposase [Bradyrhizobium yuanmingense]
MIAAPGDRSCFKNGRQFAAWLGAKQQSSGGRARLFGISKRDDRYLRALMIHGARAALSRATGKQDPRAGEMRQRRHPNVVAWLVPTRTRGSRGVCLQATQLMRHHVR